MVHGRSFALLCLSAAALALLAPGAAAEAADAVDLTHQWRSLLQAGDAGTAPPGPRTVVVVNLDTNGQPVYCINITQPFTNQTHPASGKEAPTDATVDDLAKQICSDNKAAGEKLFELVRAGEAQAKQAAQALKQANCPNPNLIPQAVTVASVKGQDSLSLGDLELYFQAFVSAMQAVGVPACVTVIESDASGQKVAAEKYFATQ